jgi:TonB-linked SusC/RagA family outer membrane protein
MRFALDELQRTSGIPVAYSPTLLPADQTVSCECLDATVEEAIETILSGSGLDFLVVADQLVIRRRVPPPLRLPDTRLSAASRMALATGAVAPLEPLPRAGAGDQLVGVISGRVTDARTGQAISAAQVHIAALDIGVLTQLNGGYVLLNVPAGTHTLQAVRIGYRTVTAEVTVTDGATVVQDFMMEEDALRLDEVIVTGTPGGARRRALGNAVSRLDASAIATSPAVRVEQVIGNSVPGVRMMAPASMAGGESSIRIRGSSSLALQGDPLIYVDGVRISSRKAFDGRGSATSRLQDIDPAMIESIEIIKGPAAATLYGTEASNGVIQIITKKGEPGETTFEVSAEVGANWQPHPAQNFGLHWYRDPVTSEVESHNLYLLLQEPEHFGEPIFQYGPIQRYSVSARGGSDLLRYYAGISRTDEEGFSRIDFAERWNVNSSLTFVPRADLSFTVNAQRITGATGDIGTLQCSLDCWSIPVRDQRTEGGAADFFRGQLYGTEDVRHTKRATWSAEVRHNPTDWFTQRLTGGIDDANMERVDFTTKVGEGFGGRLGTCGRIGCRELTTVSTPTKTLDYSATISYPVIDLLRSSTSVGLQYFERENKAVFASGENFAVSTLSTIGAASERTSSEEFVENVTLGTYIQNEFNWDDRIFLTGAVRFDDNSAFGAEFGGAVYPKVSGSWVISEESFFPQDLLGLTQMRLRGAWGKSGQQPDAFAATRLYQPETGTNQQPFLSPRAFGNPDLGPEIGSELELGFEAGLLDDRMSVDFTWYTRTTKDAIVASPIRPSLGFPGAQLVNIGETRSWGTETVVTAQLLARSSARWDMSVGLTTMGNRIEDMGGSPPLLVVALSGMPSRSQFHVEGFPIAGLFAKKVESAEFVSGNSGPVTNAMCDGGRGKRGLEMGGPPVPCAEAPDVFWGQVDPSWQVHWSSTWTLLRSWRLTAAIDAQAGHVLNADYRQAQNDRGSRNLIFQDDPIFMATQQFSRGGQAIHNAGFAKLRELSLSYTLPEAWVQTIGASSARIAASWWNVTTLWIEQEYMPDGQRIWDPEMTSPNFEYSGIATGAPPPMSHATVKLNVIF